MQVLSLMDQMLWRMETTTTPMHIGAVGIFRPPDGAGEDFAQQVYRSLRSLGFFPHPYDSVVDGGPFGQLPHWRKVTPDPEQHFHFHTLSEPGSERQLYDLVAQLHAPPLEPGRPLFEVHIIASLEGGRFALYGKAHHAATDGMGAMHTLTQLLASRPEEQLRKDDDEPSQPEVDLARLLLETKTREARGATRAAFELPRRLVGMAFGSNSIVRTALRTPRTLFNGQVGSARSFSVVQLELHRLRAVAKATGTTVNDVILALAAGAIRGYLQAHCALPDAALTASIPMGLERGDETRNAATGFVVDLATDHADPIERLRRVHASTTRGKADIAAMTRNAAEHYSLVGLVPLAVGQRTRLIRRLPPIFNFTVSNVILSATPLYLGEARLESLVPISFLVDGYGLNLTLVGYDNTVALGYVAARNLMPDLGTLDDMTHQALQALEQAIA